MTNWSRRRRIAALALVAGATVLSGCGGDDAAGPLQSLSGTPGHHFTSGLTYVRPGHWRFESVIGLPNPGDQTVTIDAVSLTPKDGDSPLTLGGAFVYTPTGPGIHLDKPHVPDDAVPVGTATVPPATSADDAPWLLLQIGPSAIDAQQGRSESGNESVVVAYHTADGRHDSVTIPISWTIPNQSPHRTLRG